MLNWIWSQQMTNKLLEFVFLIVGPPGLPEKKTDSFKNWFEKYINIVFPELLV